MGWASRVGFSQPLRPMSTPRTLAQVDLHCSCAFLRLLRLATSESEDGALMERRYMPPSHKGTELMPRLGHDYTFNPFC